MSLPPDEVLDFPSSQDSIPILPNYEADEWIAAQGLPLRREWLREGRSHLAEGELYLLPHVLTTLPYKNCEETEEWVDQINAQYQPATPWEYRPERRMGHYKCMSMSASTIMDWHVLHRGGTLATYRSLLNGQTERGQDHRPIDALYYSLAEDPEQCSDYPLLTLRSDPVEDTPIPYGVEGFARIITGTAWPDLGLDAELEAADPTLPGLTHRIRIAVLRRLSYQRLFCGVSPQVVAGDPERFNQLLITALEQGGPVFAGIRVRYATSGGIFSTTDLGRIPFSDLSGHGVVVVGYLCQNGRTYFIYRETFGEFDEGGSHGGPAYRIYPVHSFHEAYSFAPVPGDSLPAPDLEEARPR